MKVRTLLCGLVVLLVLAWTGVVPNSSVTAAEQAVVQVKQDDDGKTVHAKSGQSVEISLPGNITTGYSWTVSAIDGKSLNESGKVAYKAGQPQMPGSGGTFTARFNATAAGASTVKLVYVRPWEKASPPARVFSVKVDVEAAK